MIGTNPTVFRFVAAESGIHFDPFTLPLEADRAKTIFQVFQEHLPTEQRYTPIQDLYQSAVIEYPDKGVFIVRGHMTLAELAVVHIPRGGTLTITLEMKTLTKGK